MTALEHIWYCKIGGKTAELRDGADLPMRTWIRHAFREITGSDEEFLFSGWGQTLTEPERAVVENREPSRCEIDHPHAYACKHCGISPTVAPSNTTSAAAEVAGAKEAGRFTGSYTADNDHSNSVAADGRSRAQAPFTSKTVALLDEIEAVMRGEHGADWADHFGVLFDLVETVRAESSPETSDDWRSMEELSPTVEPPTFVLIAERKPDGSYVVGEARWFGDQGWRWAGNDPTDHWGREVYPERWMPLPPPPRSAVKSNGDQS